VWSTEVYDELWERAWTEASEFERKRYRRLDWEGGLLGTMMLVASGQPLGEAIKTAAPYAADWTAPDTPR
jgi:hypothetical protein